MPSGPPGLLLLLMASLAQAAAAGTAVLLARRLPGHRPVAWFLSVVTLANLVLLGFILAGVPTGLSLAPYEGTARLVFHIRQALFFTWSFGFVWLTNAVFQGRRIGGWLILPYFVVLGAFVGSYPRTGGAYLQQTYLVLELTSLLIGLGMLVQFAWRRQSLTVTHLVTILILFGEFAVLAGVWRKDVFGNGWDPARIMYLVSYSVLAIIQLWNIREGTWKRSV
jgi:hypothetical protein